MSRILHPGSIYAQRPAVSGNFLDIENLQSMSMQNAVGCQQGKIRKMFMIDGVEFIMFDQAGQVRKLQRENSVGFQQQLEAFDEIIDVRHLRQYIVADNQVRRFSLARKFQRELRPEKTSQRGHPLFDGHFGHVCGRFDSEDRHSSFYEVLQEVTVVTCDLDDKTLRAQSESFGYLCRVLFAVLQPGIGIGREIKIIAENVFGAFEFLELHKEAFFADEDVKRIEHFSAIDLGSRGISLTERRHAQINEGPPEIGATKTARFQSGLLRRFRRQRHSGHGILSDPWEADYSRKSALGWISYRQTTLTSEKRKLEMNRKSTVGYPPPLDS